MAINGRTYCFTPGNVDGQQPAVGERVRFNPRGSMAIEVSREAAANPGANPASVTMQPVGNGPSDAVGEVLEVLPYDFVPIDVKCAVTDAPVFHGGRNDTGGELVSGELRITLRALTPLLPGNYRYKAEEVDGIRSGPQEGEVRLPEEFGVADPVTKEKSILEPLRDGAGRVLIGGSALTGMLRHSLGALLSAPMERVTERSYSYRPNIKHARDGNRRYEVRPAAVESVTANTVTLRIFSRARAATFIRGDRYLDADGVHRRIGAPRPGTSVSSLVRGVRFDGRNHLQPDCNSERLDHYYVTYKGGIDGTGELAGRFGGRKVYRHALISSKDWSSGTVQNAPVGVFQHYRRTQEHLGDREFGHVSNRRPLLPKSEERAARRISQQIADNGELERGQLIYVEVDATGTPPRVVSLGHHYQYRQGHTDTVHKRWSGTGRESIRPLLKPLDIERVSEKDVEEKRDVAPEQLTGARLFFGYAATEKDNPGAHRVGSGAFSRLAGRLAFNIAVEQTDRPGDPSRFLNGGTAIPLKVLGQPRPSAVEFYLDQRNAGGNLLVTYGDLPGEAGGELRGRKFYRHQANVTRGHFEAGDAGTKAGNQATLIRFALEKDTEFRVALRFRDLRPWELGALLVALEPWRIGGLSSLPDEVSEWKEKAGRERPSKTDGDPLFAHKLGYGRPLGLGSVSLWVDEIHQWTHDRLEKVFSWKSDGGGGGAGLSDDQLIEESMRAFDDRMKPFWNKKRGAAIVKAWLQAHAYRGTTIKEYPVAADNHGNETIFNWHTQRRRAHAEARRSIDPNPVNRPARGGRGPGPGRQWRRGNRR